MQFGNVSKIIENLTFNNGNKIAPQPHMLLKCAASLSGQLYGLQFILLKRIFGELKRCIISVDKAVDDVPKELKGRSVVYRFIKLLPVV